jgi:hypothetical protein
MTRDDDRLLSSLTSSLQLEEIVNKLPEIGRIAAVLGEEDGS